MSIQPAPARIERVKRDWTDGRFARPEGDEEFIPLPEDDRHEAR